MKEFFKNNGKELGISVILGYFLYLIIVKGFDLSIACPPDQVGRCLLFAWAIYLILFIVFSAIVFGIILLFKHFIKKRK